MIYSWIIFLSSYPILSIGQFTTSFLGRGPGNSNGVGTNVLFYFPSDIIFSSDGKYALIADTVNHQIRKLVISTN